MDNAAIWLIQLLTAHLFTDFVLQPKSWVQARSKKRLAAKEFWFHIGLTGFAAGLFTGFDSWWVPVLIFITHGLIDWWKSYRKDNLLYFSIDQLLHVLVILCIWMLKFPEAFSPGRCLQTFLTNPHFWMVGLALVFLSGPVGIIIGMVTKPFRDQIKNHNEQSLESAGAWIGVLERLIIFFLVIIGQYEAFGLLIAAKSIIRLKEGDQKMSEYVLIGTLISISTAILTGYIVSIYL
jgi:hypothetical protein